MKIGRENALFWGIALLLLNQMFSFAAQQRHYVDVNKLEKTTHSFTYNAIPFGYDIELISDNGKNRIVQRFKVNRRMETLYWEYRNPETKTDVKAERKERRLQLSGRDGEKRIEKSLKIDDSPWIQSFNIGLEPFAMTTDKKKRFWAIGTGGPGNMKTTKFKAKFKRYETIYWNGDKTEVKHITVSLPGLLSIFWTGHYYYRKSDGIFIRFKGRNGKGKPVSTMDLREISERMNSSDS